MLQTHTHIKNFYPAYYSYGGAHIKLLSPDSYIRVMVEGGEFQCSKLKNIPEAVNNVKLCGTPCTEQEFRSGYLKGTSHVVHEAFMQQSEAATAQEIEEMHYEGAATEIFDRNEDLCQTVNQLSNYY